MFTFTGPSLHKRSRITLLNPGEVNTVYPSWQHSTQHVVSLELSGHNSTSFLKVYHAFGRCGHTLFQVPYVTRKLIMTKLIKCNPVTQIIVGSVVTRGSRSQVAPSAMAELNAARALFERAAEYGGRAKKMLVCNFFRPRNLSDRYYFCGIR